MDLISKYRVISDSSNFLILYTIFDMGYGGGATNCKMQTLLGQPFHELEEHSGVSHRSDQTRRLQNKKGVINNKYSKCIF